MQIARISGFGSTHATTLVSLALAACAASPPRRAARRIRSVDPGTPICGQLCGNGRRDSCLVDPRWPGRRPHDRLDDDRRRQEEQRQQQNQHQPPHDELPPSPVTLLRTTEACDGADLGQETCGSLGFVRGTLRCGSSCELDLRDCSNCVERGAVRRCVTGGSDGTPVNLSIATNGASVALAWWDQAERSPQCNTYVAVYHSDLRVLAPPHCVALADGNRPIFTASGDGWLLVTSGSHGGGIPQWTATPLDPQGFPRGVAWRVPLDSLSVGVERPATGPLLVGYVAQEPPSVQMGVVLVNASGGLERTERSNIPPPRGGATLLSGTATEQGFLIAGYHLVNDHVEGCELMSIDPRGTIRGAIPVATEMDGFPSIAWVNGAATVQFHRGRDNASLQIGWQRVDGTGHPLSPPRVVSTRNPLEALTCEPPVVVGNELWEFGSISATTGPPLEYEQLAVRRLRPEGSPAAGNIPVAREPIEEGLIETRIVPQGSGAIVAWTRGPAVFLARIEP